MSGFARLDADEQSLAVKLDLMLAGQQEHRDFFAAALVRSYEYDATKLRQEPRRCFVRLLP